MGGSHYLIGINCQARLMRLEPSLFKLYLSSSHFSVAVASVLGFISAQATQCGSSISLSFRLYLSSSHPRGSSISFSLFIVNVSDHRHGFRIISCRHKHLPYPTAIGMLIFQPSSKLIGGTVGGCSSSRLLGKRLENPRAMLNRSHKFERDIDHIHVVIWMVSRG